MPLTEEEVAIIMGEPRPSGRVGGIIPNRGRNLNRFNPIRRYSRAVRFFSPVNSINITVETASTRFGRVGQGKRYL